MADSLSGVDLFVTTVEAGTYSLAADRLGITRSAVGKGIARLEQRLGVQLFHRSSRSQTLTDEGSLFLRHCMRALEEMNAAEAALEGGRGKVYGRLRISMPALFGHLCVAPILLKVANEHEELALDLSFSDRSVDLFEEGYDLAIRVGVLPDSKALSARSLGEHGMTFSASEAYLQEHGVPHTLEDLKHHHGVIYTRRDHAVDWQVLVNNQLKAIRPSTRLQMDDMRAVADAAIAGFGIAWLPDWLAHIHFNHGDLVEVLPDELSKSYEISAIWPSSPHVPRKTRVVVAALMQDLPKRLAAMGRQFSV